MYWMMRAHPDSFPGSDPLGQDLRIYSRPHRWCPPSSLPHPLSLSVPLGPDFIKVEIAHLRDGNLEDFPFVFL